MKKIAVITLIISFVAILINLRGSSEISYDSFHIVSPGVIRTPDERFENLEDYNFKANYIEINGL